mmetsp:Transcript_25558/g.60796  ORF Transcript_25558/g.60796 Transcript_25558/m.60796 type:complete len:239 (-) Transcript_25558:230-946(-)
MHWIYCRQLGADCRYRSSGDRPNLHPDSGGSHISCGLRILHGGPSNVPRPSVARFVPLDAERLPGPQHLLQLRHVHKDGPVQHARRRHRAARAVPRHQQLRRRAVLQPLQPEQAPYEPPLPHLQEVRAQDGPPLPVAQQLRGVCQLPVLLPLCLVAHAVEPLRGDNDPPPDPLRAQEHAEAAARRLLSDTQRTISGPQRHGAGARGLSTPSTSASAATGRSALMSTGVGGGSRGCCHR